MEIGWIGMLLLLVAWACAGVSTGFAFHIYTRDKDYTMSKSDEDYLLTSGITSAVAVAFTTIVVLLIVFTGRDQFKAHARAINRLMTEKMELQNQLDSMSQDQRKPTNILENPIPIRRGRSARPLII